MVQPELARTVAAGPGAGDDRPAIHDGPHRDAETTCSPARTGDAGRASVPRALSAGRVAFCAARPASMRLKLRSVHVSCPPSDGDGAAEG